MPIPANAARDINLTGSSMGQLRTANNRRNRAIRQTAARKRAAAIENRPSDAAVIVPVKAAP
jgi:hypothetical protein